MEKGLTLSAREERRASVLNGIMDKRWTGKQGAEVVKVSERHLWRMLAAYREDGPAALCHGNRGSQPANMMPKAVQEQIVVLARGKYAGLNDTHLAEVLLEREGIRVPRSSLQRLLRQAGIKSPKRRRAPKHRSRRERYPQEGMLLQIDGSPHAWLEDRGPRLTLVGAIDDATGTVPYALFREQEDTQGYLLLLRGVIQAKGIPVALYSDRHSIFYPTAGEPESLEEQLAGERRPTQFGQALKALGIQLVLAHSPQAKGRVERLWGTLQDRLVSELRLAGATTLAEANQVLWRFLADFNQRFGVPPRQGGSAYGSPQGVDLNATLCFKYYRTVATDNTLRWRDQVLQLLPGKDRSSYARVRVEVQERLDGCVVILHQGVPLAMKEAPAAPATLRALKRGQLPSSRRLGGRVSTLSPAPQGAQGQAGDRGGPAHEDRRGDAAKPRPPKPGPNHPWKQRLLTKSLSNKH